MTIIEWSGTVAGNEVPLFANVADVHANGTAQRGPGDPSYRRPLTNLRALRVPEDPRALSRPKD